MVYFPKWKIILVALVCFLGVAYSIPNFLDKEKLVGVPGWLPSQQVNLGLDLQGGSHLLMEVDTAKVIDEYLETILESVRADLRRDRIRVSGLAIRDRAVSFTVREVENVERARIIAQQAEPQAFITSDDGLITIAPTDQLFTQRQTLAVQQSVEVIRRRINELGTREPTIQQQGENRILLQLPGVEDTEEAKSLVGKTAKMTFHLVDTRNNPAEALQTGRVPPGTRLFPTTAGERVTGSPSHYLVQRRVMVSGERLIDAQPSFDQRTAQPVVTFRFDTRGAQQFGKVTSENVGRPFAIVLDEEIISAPVIREAILGGAGQISGSFTTQSANELAILLRAGALPAPITFLEERSVGASLGQDSIEAGQIASIIGMILVIVFMAMAYGRFGLMADIALTFNMLLILAVLSILQATLTLPGIAGIVLTIGMAVDANVLIFERIREEVRAGRTPISAIDAGYSRALTTIIDANVTTLIAAILLFAFGSGPVRGFSVTLAVGIATSMFTAIMVTRLFVILWLRKTKPQTLPI